MKWRNCTGLTSFPAIDLSNATNLSNAWSNCTGLTSFLATGMKVNFDISDSVLLDEAAIDVVLGNLADLTGETAQTIRVPAGKGQANIIATAKNWTVDEV